MTEDINNLSNEYIEDDEIKKVTSKIDINQTNELEEVEEEQVYINSWKLKDLTWNSMIFDMIHISRYIYIINGFILSLYICLVININLFFIFIIISKEW